MKISSVYVLALCVLVSCSAEKQTSPAEATASEQWARPGAEGGTSGAYFTYTNSLDTPDTLISLSSDAARMTQLHESYRTGDGLSGMRPVSKPVLQPGEALVLEPGGLHVMLIHLRKDLSEGDTVQVRLQFRRAGKTTIHLPVQNHSP